MAELTALKCPKSNFESTLSRYLTDVQTIARAFSYNEMFPLPAYGHVQELLDTVRDTDMYVKFGKCYNTNRTLIGVFEQPRQLGG